MEKQRVVAIHRKTKETAIELKLNLDGRGQSTIHTGIPFFDHMLTLFTHHALFDLEIEARGDIEVDYHHTVEDVGIVLGEALCRAVGEKRGLRRYGFFILPMDECLARVAVDLCCRPVLVYHVPLPQNSYVRDFNIGLCKEFFQSVANNAKATVHTLLEYGQDPHHIAEALFKCFARALDQATRRDPLRKDNLPSTKGLLS